MFQDFEDLENQNEAGNDNSQQFWDSLENPSDIFSENDTVSENIYEYLENISKTYHLETHKSSNGILKESIRLKASVDTTQNSDSIYNISDAKKVWHIQNSGGSPSTLCQEFILEEYLGKAPEKEGFDMYTSETGETTVENIGKALEYHGIDTVTDYDADFCDLENALNNGNRTIVHINNVALDDSYDGVYPVWNANHTVEVIGIDKSDLNDVKVIINDPCVEDGCGKILTFDRFMNAWGTFDKFMMIADRT